MPAEPYYDYMSQGIGPLTMRTPYSYTGNIYRDNYQTQANYNAQASQSRQYQYSSPGFYPIMSTEGRNGEAQQPQEQPQPAEGTRFYCMYKPCASEGMSFGRKADLERHIAAKHTRPSPPLVDCEDPGCHRRGKYGFVRRDKMIEHMRDVHKSDIPKRPRGEKSS